MGAPGALEVAVGAVSHTAIGGVAAIGATSAPRESCAINRPSPWNPTMYSPTVTELPRRLEPISRDTFNDAVRHTPTPRRPSPSNVMQLRPAGTARRARLVAA